MFYQMVSHTKATFRVKIETKQNPSNRLEFCMKNSRNLAKYMTQCNNKHFENDYEICFPSKGFQGSL